MDKTKTQHPPQKLSFLHHIRLVPLFSAILGGIILLFALSSGLAGYFLLQAEQDQKRCYRRTAGADGLIKQF